MRLILRSQILMVSSRIVELCSPRSAKGRSGQELVEYALIVGFIAVSAAAFIPYSITAPISSIFSKIAVYLTKLGNG